MSQSHHRTPNSPAPNSSTSSNADLQALFTAELEKFRPYQSRISQTIASQEATLEDVARRWKALKSGKEGRALVKKAEVAEKRRNAALVRFAKAREGWMHVREGAG